MKIIWSIIEIKKELLCRSNKWEKLQYKLLAKTNAWEVSKVLFDASALVIKRKDTKILSVKLFLINVVAHKEKNLFLFLSICRYNATQT